MNTLSWLFYFSSLSSSLAILGGIVGGFSLLLGVIFTFMLLTDSRDHSDTFLAHAPRLRRLFLIVGFIGLFVSSVFPGQNTMYLIIASESAEMVVSSPEGAQMLSDIQRLVSIEIEEMMTAAPQE